MSSGELKVLLERTQEFLEEKGGRDWQIVPLNNELGLDWMSYESASAEVVLILAALQARKLRKPQPFLSPAEAPLKKSDLLLASGSCLSTSWEDWHQLSPAAQGRPLVANERKVCVILFGKPLGEITPEMDDPRMTQKEFLRQQKWDSLPRELKLAIRRVHVNLGHATTAQMLKAMRISRASEVAIRAVRLFQCPDCPRAQAPRPPRPSKLPLAEEFNVQIGLDVFQAKDADGQSWSWFNVLCQATTFQVCSLLADTHANPTSSAVLQAFETSWTSWAGYPESGLFTDRAKYFVTDFAEALAAEGCHFDTSARASPWQVGQVERHGMEIFGRTCYGKLFGASSWPGVTTCFTSPVQSMQQRMPWFAKLDSVPVNGSWGDQLGFPLT